MLTHLKLMRLGFAPTLFASNVSMYWAAAALSTAAASPPAYASVTATVIANLLWMLYGSFVNDACDLETDANNPTAAKTITLLLPRQKQRVFVIVGTLLLTISIDAFVVGRLVSTGSVGAAILFTIVTLVGAALGTAYSAPPIRARSRLFGATWTLMAYHPFCFLRIVAVTVTVTVLFRLRWQLVFVCVFLWACHGITTAAMKDVPDAFADRSAGIRSIPNAFGAVAATTVSVLFIILACGAASVAVVLGFLQAQAIGLLVPLLTAYFFLAVYLHRWYVHAEDDPVLQRITPRALFHRIAYLGTWGIAIPIYMLNIRPT